MNELVMFRVNKAQVRNRDAYRYFAGLNRDGTGVWAEDMNARAIVHTFPRGWVNRPVSADENVLEAWLPSVVYNAPLGLYLMANWGTGCGQDGRWFAKPSYLGFWVANNPWGPWLQIHEEEAWTPADDVAARCYTPVIAPKWISADGRSFWVMWTDFKGFPEFMRKWTELPEKGDPFNPSSDAQGLELMRQTMPYYALNTQRFDFQIG